MNNGELLAIFTNFGLIKIDKDSNLLWSYKGMCHHDLFVAENGNIYVLVRKVKKPTNLQLESLDLQGYIIEDFITILSPEGKKLREISLLECFRNSEYAPLLEHIKVQTDLLHTNTVRPIDGKLVDRYPMFKKGHILISMREIHTIAIVDPEHEKITWALTGMWAYQHEPRLLENGNLLLFDNRGNNGKSKVIEVNPLTQEVVWSYKGELGSALFSKKAGSNDRLPNGNTLIIESNNGRALEVTPAGEIVWEFYNPKRAGKDDALIAAIWDVIRLDPGKLDWLAL